MNEVNYHVVPDLTPEVTKILKTTAIELGITVKELVRQAILLYLQPQINAQLTEEDKT